MNQSKSYVSTIAATFAGRIPISYAFLLKKGTEFSNMGKQPKLRAPKDCFRNAYRFAAANNLHYCEGYAVPRGINFPLEHAWCCDDLGNIYDPTWKDATDYFGVPFTLEAVETIMNRTGYYGIFGNLYLLRQEPEPILKMLMDSIVKK